jgi:hypothetical protein
MGNGCGQATALLSYNCKGLLETSECDGALTLTIMTYSIITLSMIYLFKTLSINDSMSNSTGIMLSVIMLSVALF